jgi:hypothetical protein
MADGPKSQEWQTPPIWGIRDSALPAQRLPAQTFLNSLAVLSGERSLRGD